MSDHADLVRLYEQHSVSQDKYTYFLLAAAGAAVAFAVQKTEGAPITWALFPAGVAVVSWAFSFYCGCIRIGWVQAAIHANFSLLQLRLGSHPEQPPHPQMVEAAIKGVGQALAHNAERANTFAKLQFYSLIVGAGFFLIWHVLVMAVTTQSPN